MQVLSIDAHNKGWNSAAVLLAATRPGSEGTACSLAAPGFQGSRGKIRGAELCKRLCDEAGLDEGLLSSAAKCAAMVAGSCFISGRTRHTRGNNGTAQCCPTKLPELATQNEAFHMQEKQLSLEHPRDSSPGIP